MKNDIYVEVQSTLKGVKHMMKGCKSGTLPNVR